MLTDLELQRVGYLLHHSSVPSAEPKDEDEAAWAGGVSDSGVRGMSGDEAADGGDDR